MTMASKVFVFLWAILGVLTLYYGFYNHQSLSKFPVMNQVRDILPFIDDIIDYFHRGKVSTSKNEMQSDKQHSKKEGHHDWMKGPKTGMPLLTDTDIAYAEGKPLNLVILGHVFDVTKGAKHYGPGTGYHGFIGQDGSRAFISGDFTKDGLTSDVEGLSAGDYDGLVKWLQFYFEAYTFVGYHIGRYFDESGSETAYMKKFKNWVVNSEKVKEAEQDVKKQFPPCNVEWTAEKGTRYWCSKKSGGVDRAWEGFPYQFTENNGKSVRCTCVQSRELNDPRLKPYEKCSQDFTSCYLPPS